VTRAERVLATVAQRAPRVRPDRPCRGGHHHLDSNRSRDVRPQGGHHGGQPARRCGVDAGARTCGNCARRYRRWGKPRSPGPVGGRLEPAGAHRGAGADPRAARTERRQGRPWGFWQPGSHPHPIARSERSTGHPGGQRRRRQGRPRRAPGAPRSGRGAGPAGRDGSHRAARTELPYRVLVADLAVRPVRRGVPPRRRPGPDPSPSPSSSTSPPVVLSDRRRI